MDYRVSYIMSMGNQTLSLKEAVEKTGINQEELMFELKKLVGLSEKLLNEQIELTENHIKISQSVSKNWLTLMFGRREEEVIYSEQERQAMIYFLTFSNFEELSVFYFQEFFMVSKNTILTDVKKLRGFLNHQHVALEYSRRKGFFLSGEESAIRAIAYDLLGELIAYSNGKRLLYKGLLTVSTQFYAEVRRHFSKTIESFNLMLVPSRFEEMVYFISYLIGRTKTSAIQFSKADQELLRNLAAGKASEQFLQAFSGIKDREMEVLYITILFMTVVQGEIQDSSLDFLLACAGKIIHEVERLAAVEFQEYRKLLLDLFYHLVPAYFRIRFGLPLNNVLIEEIVVQYHEIFEITKRSLYPLERLVQRSIPIEEVGYFTVLFGGTIRSRKVKKQDLQLQGLILCPSGISSSMIMKSELQELFPQIDFSETSSFEAYNETEGYEEIDMIFSSVPIKTEKRLYVINPIMSQLEKNTLMREVQEDFLFQKTLIPSVDEIIDILFPHIVLKKGITKEKLYKIVQKKMNKEMKRREDDRPMLSELLTEEMIQLSDSSMDWEEAIDYAAEPLKKENKIEPRYVTAMINKVKKHGPFIHIGEGVALPHARPEEGVKGLGMSLLKVQEPILLLDDEKHPIQIFICLAAVDNEMHLKALASLTRILSNKEKLSGLLQAETKQEILEIITEGED
ncbi:BglG family transcription antiterminator [Enterococcus sp. BWR-S5]|uniref:BglG family transcription antiterminator n=1 Tax=Enterococcus sp. BWR-S5 TaxID=2787714 RepID=UPI0019221C65|nr:PTS sugar transporter subunit IIA [Enterococcus sp. BWR-S5]MBL1226209.1 BglG family transcription antiterminator [Enterococcus sp. BWR-S5]